jgi:DNA-binding transcriptional MerR regulator
MGPVAAEIPDKSYFKIGEVSRILGVEPYNIRYWESQFRIVKPAKTKSRQRLYRRRDIEVLLQIKQLLYEEGYTIAGAKKRLKTVIEGVEADVEDDDATPSMLSDEERRAYDERLASSQGELQALRAEASKLHEELSRLRAEHQAQLALYDADRDALVARLKAQPGNGADREEHGRLAARVAELEAENARLREQLAQTPAELGALKERLSMQSDRSASLERELGQMRRQARLLAEAVRLELRPLLGLVEPNGD